MKQQSTQSRTRKQVMTYREEYQAMATPVGQEKSRGVSAHSANQTKLQNQNKQRTPIQLLQAKHKHLEVQLAKLSAEVAQQNREIKVSSEQLVRNASSKQYPTDSAYDQIATEYFASPINIPFDPESEQSSNQKPSQLDRSGSINSAKKKRVIKMQQIKSGALPVQSNIHVPGSDPNGYPLASYIMQPSAFDQQTFSPNQNKQGQPKVKIERKKIPAGYTHHPELLEPKKQYRPSSNNIRGTNAIVINTGMVKGASVQKLGMAKKSAVVNSANESGQVYFYPSQVHTEEDLQYPGTSKAILTPLIEEETTPRGQTDTALDGQALGKPTKQQSAATTPSMPLANVHPPQSYLTGARQMPATARQFENLYKGQLPMSAQEKSRLATDSLFQAISTEENNSIETSLENGFLQLHSNLKNLEASYIDLANFYKQELTLLNQKVVPKKLFGNETLERTRIDAVKTEKIKIENQLKKLILQQAKLSDDDAVCRLNEVVLSTQTKLIEQYETGMLTKGAIRVTLQSLQSSLREVIVHGHRSPELSSVQSEEMQKVITEFELSHEYQMNNVQESLFQLTNTNDKIKLDLKKIGLLINELHKKAFDQINDSETELSKLINQLNLGFAQIHSKAVNNQKVLRDLQLLSKESIQATARLGQQLKVASQPKSVGLSKLEGEIAELKQQCEFQQSAYDGLERQKVVEVQDLEDRLRALKDENASLRVKLDRLQTLPQPSISSETTHKESRDADWRSLCESQSDLVVKFMNSMRRLQKVVHKKESNVQQEKQDFELSKKELEVCIRHVKSALESGAISVSSHDKSLTNKLELVTVKPPATQSVRVNANACIIGVPTNVGSSQTDSVWTDLQDQIHRLQSENTSLRYTHVKEKKQLQESALRILQSTAFKDFVEPVCAQLEKQTKRVDQLAKQLELAKAKIRFNSQNQDQERLIEKTQAAEKIQKLEQKLTQVTQANQKDQTQKQRQHQKAIEQAEGTIATLKAQLEKQTKDFASQRKEDLVKMQIEQEGIISKFTQEALEKSERLNALEKKIEQSQLASNKSAENMQSIQQRHKKELSEQQRQLAALKKDNEQLRTQLDDTLTSRTGQTAAVTDLQQQLATAMGDIEMLRIQLDEAVTSRTQLIAAVELAQHQLEEARQQIFSIQGQLKSSQKVAEQLQDELANQRAVNKTLKDEVAEVKQEKTAQATRSACIEAELKRERDLAQEQVSLFLDKAKSEQNNSQTKEQKLIKSLNQTLEQLNKKEDECDAHLNRINELTSEKEEQAAQLRDLYLKIEQQSHQLSKMVELEEEANLHREENEELRRANDEFAVVNDDLQNRIEEMERLNIQRDDQAESEKQDLNGQLESAQRKIDNYKDKLLEKVDVIRRLELELAQTKTEAPNILENDSLADSFMAIQQENVELLQKLQMAEQALAAYRDRDQSVDISQLPAIEKPKLTPAEHEQAIATLDRKLFEFKKQLQLAQAHCIAAILSQIMIDNPDANPEHYQAQMAEDNEELINLKMLVNDLRQDRLQIQHELEALRNEPYSKGNADKSALDVSKIRDDIDFFTAENLELQSKVKEVCLQNAQLKIQILQLSEAQIANNMQHINNRRLQDSLGSDGGEDAYVLEDVLTARNENADVDEEVETAMFQVAKNNQDEDQLGDDLENNINAEAADDFVSEGSFREEMQHIQGTLESTGKKWANNELIALRQQLTEAEQQIKTLKEELQGQQDDVTIAHIKGTLIQFLKNIPLTEPKNEEVLKILYSMMSFTPSEINDLYNQRANHKAAKQGNPRAASTNAGNSSSFTGAYEEEPKKKGWFNFGGTKKDQNTSAGNIAPMQKPIKR